MAREGRRKHVVGIMAAREDHRDPPPLQLLGHGKDQLAAQVHVQQRAVQGLLLREPQRLVELRHRADRLVTEIDEHCSSSMAANTLSSATRTRSRFVALPSAIS